MTSNNTPSVNLYTTTQSYTNYSTEETSEVSTNQQTTNQENTLNKSQTVGTQVLVNRVYETESEEGEGGYIKDSESAQTVHQVHHYSTTSSLVQQTAHMGITAQHAIQDLAQQVKATRALFNEPLPELHLPEQEGRAYQNLTGQIKGALSDSYESTMKYIQDMGPAFIALAQQKQADQTIEWNAKTLLFTQKGKVFVETRELGKGQFNKTVEVVLVASTKLASLEQEQMKVSAFRLAKPSTDPRTAQLEQEERELNLYIKDQAEQGLALGLDLSHVHIAKRITDVNTGQVGVMSVGVMSAVQQGNINQLVTTINLDWGDKLQIATQMAQGIEQLHSIDIVHRDLKLDNFLYKPSPNGDHFVQVSDFGLSSRQDPAHRSTNAQIVVWHADPAWAGTSLNSEVRFSKESDVFQFGVTLCQFLSDNTYNIKDWTNLQIAESRQMREEADAISPPPNTETEAQTIARGRRLWKNNPDKWQGLAEIPDTNVRNMVRQMVDPDPAKRPSMTEVVNFFNSQ